jgi:hypothetical protein
MWQSCQEADIFSHCVFVLLANWKPAFSSIMLSCYYNRHTVIILLLLLYSGLYDIYH